MKKNRHLLLLALIFGCTSPIQISNQTSSKNHEITEGELLSHIKFLSDDKRMGRFPGTQGSEEAIKYIINNLQSSNVLPAGTEGFLQPFEFVTGIKADNDTRLAIEGNNLRLNK